ncbi:MAG TPA: hypothetical protein VFE85_06835, partial [Woeseiaceae bacterium]|nr:hypothetical protein [Woeseiaceae bacterium]
MSSRRRRNTTSGRMSRQATPAGHAGRAVSLLPLAFAAGLALLSVTARVQQGALLEAGILGAATSLVLLHALLFAGLARHRAPARRVSVVLRPQHYVQALVQSSIFVYWGYYWAPIQDHLWLIAAQLLFAYGFDM